MNDSISRQAAIDALNGNITVTGEENAKAVQKYIRSVSLKIHDLPSVQPEIVRCKDCVKREHCRTSTVWAVAPNDDWYCADAKRITDE